MMSNTWRTRGSFEVTVRAKVWEVVLTCVVVLVACSPMEYVPANGVGSVSVAVPL